MRSADISGISNNFLELSKSRGQVAHVLLTRSPLIPHRRRFIVRLACVKHAASVRPEPKSNAPEINSIPGREPRPDRSRYQSTQRNPQKGVYYLALTFGTLLSSQGTDAHQPHPERRRRWRLVHTTPRPDDPRGNPHRL